MPSKPDIKLRAPSQIMTLETLGALHQTRLSFMRTLIRDAKKQNWTCEKIKWDINQDGFGTAIYTVKTEKNHYSLICFSNKINDDQRSDRVIATVWDASFVLFDGKPTEKDIKRLKKQTPKQEAGRFTQSELCLSRTNKSMRLFNHAVNALANGKQPNKNLITKTGYLMRTTAVYGNGKFGIADRDTIKNRNDIIHPFRLELLSVWMIRTFTIDLVEHIARKKNPKKFTKLNPNIKRQIGIGNATGLGMAPFLVNHPALLHQWIKIKETALQKCRNLKNDIPQKKRQFIQLLERSALLLDQWETNDPVQTQKIKTIKKELKHLSNHIKTLINKDSPWNQIYQYAKKNYSHETNELIISAILEPQGDLIDPLAHHMHVNEDEMFHINGAQKINQIIRTIEKNYQWAININFKPKNANARFWYISKEKLEPRLGERFEEIGAEAELPLDVAKNIQSLYHTIIKLDRTINVARFLNENPQYRHAVRRVQINQKYPYSEIHDNLIDKKMIPIDILRAKLSFFGATKFDPQSDRWLRITLFQNAPFIEDIQNSSDNHDDWLFPQYPQHRPNQSPAQLMQ